MDLSLEEAFDFMIALIVSSLFLAGGMLVMYNQVVLMTIERVS